MLAPSTTSPETDKEALLAIFESTGGETWDRSGTWGGFSPVGNWPGVGVDEMGRVTSLDISGLDGELPPELGNLSNLQTLSITNSQIDGGLPSELGNLTALQTLELTNNQLAGELSPELGNLSNLQTLSITNSQLAGQLPPELGKLTSLDELHLSSNQICGEIPPELDGLTGLGVLDLERQPAQRRDTGCAGPFGQAGNPGPASQPTHRKCPLMACRYFGPRDAGPKQQPTCRRAATRVGRPRCKLTDLESRGKPAEWMQVRLAEGLCVRL